MNLDKIPEIGRTVASPLVKGGMRGIYGRILGDSANIIAAKSLLASL